MHATTLISTETIRAYQAEQEAELSRILMFWESKGQDQQQGGFVGRIDTGGHVDLQAPKGAILNARILWTFSAAYKHSGQQQHLLLAKRAYSYFMEHFWDQVWGGVYWSVDAQGNALETRKQIYAQAFAMYGLSEYYSITRETRALRACQELFMWIEKYSYDQEQGGYFEAFSREGVLLEDLRLSPKDRNDPKTMNTHLHILEAYANLYRVWRDGRLAQQLEGLIELFLSHIIDPATHHLHLFFSREWGRTAMLVSYGHDIEASWLLEEAAEVLGKFPLLRRVQQAALKMAAATKESLRPDGSLYHESDLSSGHVDRHREWWVSAEAMVGFLNAYQHSQNPGFWEASKKAWQFIKGYLLDMEQGEWYWGVWDDYSLMQGEDKAGFWKCPYHNTRACLEVIRRCNQLLAAARQE